MKKKFSKKIIEKILRDNYSYIGDIKKISSFKNIGLNSIIYYFKTKKKNFLIKIIPDPNKIFGDRGGQERIISITNIIVKISKNYNFENFLKNNKGNYTTIFDQSVVRVTKYIKPLNLRKKIFLKSILILNKIHKELWKKINYSDKKRLIDFSIPYTLDETLKKNKKIKYFLKKELKKSKSKINTTDIKKLLSNYDLIAKIAIKIKKIKKKSFFFKKSFTHNDFHPGNVIFDRNKNINLFDFDNIQYSNTFRCLYLFLLRFAFDKKKINKSNFDDAYNLLRKNYFLKIPNYLDSIEFTLYVEIEKIFKILCRVSEGNGLEIFVKKIIKVHLPNVLFLKKLLENEKQKSSR